MEAREAAGEDARAEQGRRPLTEGTREEGRECAREDPMEGATE